MPTSCCPSSQAICDGRLDVSPQTVPPRATCWPRAPQPLLRLRRNHSAMGTTRVAEHPNAAILAASSASIRDRGSDNRRKGPPKEPSQEGSSARPPSLKMEAGGIAQEGDLPIPGKLPQSEWPSVLSIFRIIGVCQSSWRRPRRSHGHSTRKFLQLNKLWLPAEIAQP